MKLCMFITLILFSLSAISADYELSKLIIYSDYDNSKDIDLGESVSIVSSQDAESSNASSTEDILESVPGIGYSGGSSRPKFFQIRGVGERSLYEGAPNHSVGIYIDGIDVSGMGSVGSLFGIEQIEVVKSSQPTKFGANALAGVINYNTQAPSEELSLKSELGYGNYNTIKGGVLTSNSIKGLKSKFLISTYFESSDGHTTNSYTKGDTTEDIKESTTRFKLNTDFGNELYTELSVYYYNQQNGYDAWSHDNSRTTMSDQPGDDDLETIGSSLKIKKELKNSDQIISNTSYALSFEDNNYDEDWGNDEYWNTVPGYNANYNYAKEDHRKRYNLSEELRYKGSSYNIGVYGQLFNEDAIIKSFKDNSERPTKRIESNFERKTFSVFADKSVSLSNKTLITFGLRTEYYNFKYKTESDQNYKDNNALIGGNIKLEHYPSSTETRFINISRGYKQGGVNTEATVDDDKRYYDPEFMYGIEVGSKKDWSNKLYTKISFFGNYREDAQVKTTFQDDPMDPSSFSYYKGNAAESYQIGVDAYFKSKVTKKIELSGDIALLRAKFLDYQYEDVNKKGRDLAYAPTLHGVIKGAYYFTDKTKFTAEYTGKDSYYFSDTHDQQSHFYGLLNTYIDYQFKKLNISLWAKNIFDKDYSTRGFYFANEPPDWNDKLYTQKGAPRTVGITLRSSF